MRFFTLAMTILLAAPVAMQAPAWSQSMPESRSFNSGDRGNYRPGDRTPRQRYVCVLDRRDGARRSITCPADAGRVGGRCRCDGTTGSGRLRTY